MNTKVEWQPMASFEDILKALKTRVTRVGNTILIPLPRDLWRSAGRCDCPYCKGQEGFWDTLAVSATPPIRHDSTWTVHAPAAHGRGGGRLRL